jgi:hypothetical protein
MIQPPQLQKQTRPAKCRLRLFCGNGSGNRFALTNLGSQQPKGWSFPFPTLHRFIELKKSSFDLVFFILSSMNSIADSSSIGCSSLREI